MLRQRAQVAGFVLFAAVALAAQAPQTPTPPVIDQTVPISGRVIDGVSGRPIAGVRVRALPARDYRTPVSAADFTNTETGADGTFAFTNFQPGRVSLAATSPGYQLGYPDSLGPNDPHAGGMLDLIAGRRIADVVIKLWPPATIAGLVEDAARDPLVGASVELLHRSFVGTSQIWVRSSVSVRTDDRGRYTFANVRPGTYLVAAPAPAPLPPNAPLAGRETLHDTVFHPNATDVTAATPITVSSGDTRESINVTVPAVASDAVAFSGRLVGSSDSLFGVTVRVIPADAPDSMAAYYARSVTTDPTGAFSIRGLKPGHYRVIVAKFPRFADVQVYGMPAMDTSPSGMTILGRLDQPLPKLPDLPTFVADQLVNLTQTLTDVEIPLRAAARVRGRVEFDLTGPRPTEDQLLSLALMPRPTNSTPMGYVPLSRLEADGSFSTIGLPPGSYRLGVLGRLGFGFAAKSTRVNGVERDTAVVELGADDVNNVVLTLTDKRTELTGMVSDSAGRPARVARVFLFARNPQERAGAAYGAPLRVRQFAIGPNGDFMQPVAPGDYLVAALSTIPANWDSPEFLESLAPLATRVTIALGDKKAVDLRVRALP
jgi:hypothetical protein